MNKELKNIWHVKYINDNDELLCRFMQWDITRSANYGFLHNISNVQYNKNENQNEFS